MKRGYMYVHICDLRQNKQLLFTSINTNTFISEFQNIRNLKLQNIGIA